MAKRTKLKGTSSSVQAPRGLRRTVRIRRGRGGNGRRPSDGRKAAEAVAEQVRARIAKGEAKPGDALPSETVLMEEFGVARPTMREAIRILESDGLIKIQRGVYGGARVQHVDLDLLARRAGLYLQMHGTTVHDLGEAQSLIEPHAVALAARRRKKADIKELRSIVDRVRKCNDPEEFAGCAADFHLALFRISGNHTLGLFATLIRSLLRQEYHHSMENLDPGAWRVIIDSGAAWYPKLVDLIEAGDVDAAQEYWARHQHMAQTDARRFIDTRGREPLNLFP